MLPNKIRTVSPNLYFHKFLLNLARPFLHTSTFSLSTNTLRKSQTQAQPFFTNFLIETLGFPETEALSVSKRYSRVKSTENPQYILHSLKKFGFSELHIRSAIRLMPQLLLSDFEKTLKPKLEFLQDLGLAVSDLSKLISRNPGLLHSSLNRSLKPCIGIIKNVLENDNKNKDLITVLSRCSLTKDPQCKLLYNIEFLRNCGIVGSQLSMLLKRSPRLFVMKKSVIQQLISRLLDMGFSIDSRMLAHGLYAISCLSIDTFRRKFELFRGLGFLEDEPIEMFRRAPHLLKSSEEKLKLGIDFFMNTIQLERTSLVRRPQYLMYSMGERVMPRYRVLEVIESKKLLRKKPSFVCILELSREDFLKYILRFRDDAEELLVAYRGHIVCSPEEQHSNADLISISAEPLQSCKSRR